MKRTFLAVLGLSLIMTGCSDPVPPAAPSPVAPTKPETFTGTLTLSGENMHTFTVDQVGGLKVTLDSVTPSAAVGLGVGTPSTGTGTCLVLDSLTAVGGPSVQLSGTATVVGTFCVAVSDVGNLVEPVTYSVTVLHS